MDEINAKHKEILLQSQLEVQEQTFKNISKEIHNNIGQKLTLAKFKLNNLDFEDLANVNRAVEKTVDMISESMDELRSISRSMSSDIVDGGGLLEGLEFEAEQLKKFKIQNVTVELIGTPVFLSSYVELVIFRIVQEGLNNIGKHSFASVVTVRLNYETDLLVLEIKDNGIGFQDDPSMIQKNGIQNIKKRTRLLQGTCTFLNENGAKIRIEIPYHKNTDLQKETNIKYNR